MSKLLSNVNVRGPVYSAPTLTIYGAATKLTASGTGTALESSGGTCSVTPTTKVRC